MYTVEETLDEVAQLGGWGALVEDYNVTNRRAVVWHEQVENKHGSDPWKTCYIVRYWENNEWKDTRYFSEEALAMDFARDFVNGPHRFPLPTD